MKKGHVSQENVDLLVVKQMFINHLMLGLAIHIILRKLTRGHVGILVIKWNKHVRISICLQRTISWRLCYVLAI